VEHPRDTSSDNSPAARRRCRECNGYDVFGSFETLFTCTFLNSALTHELPYTLNWWLSEVLLFEWHVDVVDHQNTFFVTCDWANYTTLSRPFE